MRPDARRNAWSTALSQPLVLAALLCTAAFATGAWRLPHTPTETLVYSGVLSVLVPVFAVVVCLQAARRVPGERFAWWAAAAGFSFNIAGDLAYRLLLVSGGEPPFPSVADVFWLGSYPALFAVPLLFVRARLAWPHAGTWLDGVIGALGVTAVAVAVVIVPAVPSADLSALATAANLAYPVADVLLLTLVGAVLAIVGFRADPVLTSVCVILTSKFAGDLMLAKAQAGGGYVPGGPLDLFWMANACLAAVVAAAARPRRRQQPAADTGSPVRWRSLVIPVACAVSSLVVLGARWGDGAAAVEEVLALACLAAFLLRTAVSFAESRGLHEARRQASTDDLTGLPNRRALLQRLDRRLTAGRPTGLLLLDLNGFKAVNDGLGHEAGDELLRQLGARLLPEVRPTDLLARLGGDEFAVVLPTGDPADAEECAERIATLIHRPVEVAGVPVQVGVSIGIALAPEHATDVSGLLHCADVAMYAAKASGGGVQRFSPGGPDAAPAPAGGDGSETGRLEVRPVLDADGRVVVADAVPGAGDGNPAGTALLPDALAAVARWWADHPVPVQLTLLPLDEEPARLPARIAAELLRTGLPPEALVVRLRTDIPDTGDVSALLGALRRSGVRTAVDGHGPGVLALTRLRDLPADRIHLDPALVRDVVADPRASLVVGHTVALAGALGGTVVADSVDRQTDAVLGRLGCQVLGAPGPAMTPEAFRAWLERGGDRPTPAPAGSRPAQPS
ncbi:diguanylate cyclase domain-containing protein [Blastococcus sp. VKM Ac-2987]|uniref:diguanylate cyclase domain-containing protein n=1 Tax=Blastococcus sp. VKM Ac-2987 TaxID=3004141 RepID=UPI0022ABC47E|nr:diguanylate cyclase [Blastococcus sp. VKM Ac-2987]MCZ2857165.1 diguanylate cyclase [Blastococcus sp. VKM Ac-2987]